MAPPPASRAVLALHVLVTLLACASCTREAPAGDAWKAEVASWKHPAPIPDFPLVDQAGRAFHLHDLAGRKTVVAFVFTRCPVADACPMTMSRLQQTSELRPILAPDAQLQFLVVTLDPDYDTPAVLSAYMHKFKVDVPGFTMATSSKEVVDAMSSLFNVIALRRNETIDHPVKVALLDEKLAPVREWTNNDFVPEEILDASLGQ
jgi:protein SCO1/2